MLRYLLRRVLASIPVLLVASFITFVARPRRRSIRSRSSDTRETPPGSFAEQRKALGLDHPIVVQWWNWLKGFVRGDMGTSSRTQDSVSSMIRTRLWPSLQLLFWATIVSVSVAVLLERLLRGEAVLGRRLRVHRPLVRRDRDARLLVRAHRDRSARDGRRCSGSISTSPIVYSVGLHSEGMSGINLDYFRHLALPVLTLTVTSVAAWSRFERASMLDVLNADYVRTARAEGRAAAQGDLQARASATR